jgi:hypothetical protein
MRVPCNIGEQIPKQPIHNGRRAAF